VGAWTRVDTGERQLPVLVARPGMPESGAVIVVHHRTGIDRFVIDVVTRLCSEGLGVVVPDLFAGIPAHPDPEVRKAQLRDVRIERDMRATARLAASLTGHGPSIVGFCMGGRIALLAAVTGVPVSRAACFYGGAIQQPWGEGPAPLDLLTARTPPVQFHRGVEDVHPDDGDTRALLERAQQTGAEVDLCTYAGAGHAFLDPYREDAYAPRAAARAWTTATAFLLALHSAPTTPIRK
jgi:carboxymethylenebutenolidase